MVAEINVFPLFEGKMSEELAFENCCDQNYHEIPPIAATRVANRLG